MNYEHTQFNPLYLGILAFTTVFYLVLVNFVLPEISATLVLLMSALLLVLATVMFFVGSMRVEVEDKTIGVRMLLGRINAEIPIKDVVDCQLTTNGRLFGWGIDIDENAVLYSVANGPAVELTLYDNRQVYIGSDQPERLATVIRGIMNQTKAAE